MRFTSGRSALKIPFRLYNNHIYLRVAVNGSAPLWFVLDTGARNIIASKHARALGLKLTQAGQAAGNGEKIQDVFTTENVSFALPGVTVTRQKFSVLDFDGLEECSNEIDVDAQGNMVKRQRSRKGDERQPFESCGIGGGSMSRVGKPESLRLGGFDVKSPVTSFSQAGAGNLISTDYDGLIGNAVLRRFNAVFDHARGRMILESPAKSGN